MTLMGNGGDPSTANHSISLTPRAPVAQTTPKHLKPVPSELAAHMSAIGVTARDPIYIRVFKAESELEVWKQRADRLYTHVKTFPICTFSGALGPKQRYADYQSPEGFYGVTARLMKPDSAHHLAFNIGYPNAVDRALGRTGDSIMVHGRCKSVGCFAMTDGPMEEIYALAREALAGGQQNIPVHSFPFRMTASNMGLHAQHPQAATWQPLERAYQQFEARRTLPTVAMCGRSYVVNPVWAGRAPEALEATAPCPLHELEAALTVHVEEASTGEIVLPAHNVAQGIKQRSAESIATWHQTRARAAVMVTKLRDIRREKIRVAVAARDEADARSSLGIAP